MPAGADPAAAARLARLVDTVQTVLTALILAFIFRAFLVEQFIIPTGSMAETLLGAHASRVCPACGWQYDFAPAADGDSTGRHFRRPPEVLCPNCQLRLIPTAEDTFPKAGDRILVSKAPYGIGGPLGPRRWDVIVFRDPASPDLHYIKRIVGLPGETVEIIDGDVFINGRIERKPPDVQRRLWFIVYDQAHAPDPGAASGRVPRWMPLEAPGDRGWSGVTSRVIRHAAGDDVPRTIAFNPDTGREYLLDLYGYNRRSSGAYVGDVRILAELTPRGGAGWIRWELRRPPHRFELTLDHAGQATLTMRSAQEPADETLLGSARIPGGLRPGRPTVIEFGHVDYRVYAAVNGRELLASTDDRYAPRLDVLRAARGARPVALAITARGLDLELRGLRIDRDVHYTLSGRTRRATPGHPFALHDDEFFVLGDNSPDSHDSREWSETGPHLPPGTRAGIVRRDQIVGQAGFVYLPGLLRLDGTGLRIVPDLGRTRLVR